MTRRIFALIALAFTLLVTLPACAGLRLHGTPVVSGIPASVNAPVNGGTDLTAVWNLQFGGTGPQHAPSNGTWTTATCVPATATNIPAYLAGIGGPNGGFIWGNDCSLFLNAGASNLTISNYNFASSPQINVDGTATVTFQDDTMPNPGSGGGIAGARNINANPTGNALTVLINNGLMNIATFFPESGTLIHFDHTRFTGQIQNLGDAAGSLWIDWGYITGGGLNPPPSAHVEYDQFNSTSPSFLLVSNTISNSNGENQANVPLPAANAGWTSLWSTTAGTSSMTLLNYIGIGITELDASTIRANRVGGTIFYDDSHPVTITNSILEQAHGAPGGYSNNGTPGGLNRPVVSKNRTFGNVPLTAPDFNFIPVFGLLAIRRRRAANNNRFDQRRAA